MSLEPTRESTLHRESKATLSPTFEVLLERAAAALKSASTIALATHLYPDADAYGSMCGLGLALREMGKQVSMSNGTLDREKFLWIPGVSEVKGNLPLDAELAVIVDTAHPNGLGPRLAAELLHYDRTLVIDHHRHKWDFGHTRLIVPERGSASELVTDLLVHMGHPISPAVANALYAGISGDSGSFRHASTTAETFATAATLVRAGADPVAAAIALHGSVSKEGMALRAKAIQALQYSMNGRLAEAVLRRQDFEGSSPANTTGIVDMLRDIKGVEVAVLISEVENGWRVNIRAKHPLTDLLPIAARFRCSAHPMAVGFVYDGDLSVLETTLHTMLSDAIDPRK